MPNQIERVLPKVFRAKDVAVYLGIGVSTVWRWQREGILPQGTRLTPRCTVWRLEDIETLLSAGREAAA